MRIVLCAEFPLADDRVVGGIEEVARRLGGAMAERGDHDVHAVSFHGGLPAPRVDDVRGVTVHRFPLPRRLGNLTFGAAERRATADAIRRLAPDVVHPLGLGPKALAAADAGAPWVVSVNGIQSNEARTAGGWKNRARAWAFARMEDTGLRRATDVIVPNEVVRGMLDGRLGGARVHRIENAVDERFFAAEPLREAGRIVCIGRLLPLKAPEDLIDAVARLAADGAAPRVRFVGPPDDERYLEGLHARVRRAGLEDRVEFLGFVSDDRLLEELRFASLLVHPSRVEVAPLSVMQAMAGGLPVVATDVGGTRHLVADRATGRLVPPGRPGELAAAIGELLADPEGAAALGRAGREQAAARFRTDRVVERTLRVYEGLPRGGRSFETTGWRSRNSLELQGVAPQTGKRGGQS